MTEPDDVPTPPLHDVPADEDVYGSPVHPGKPPYEYHDAEAMLPPPVSGSTD